MRDDVSRIHAQDGFVQDQSHEEQQLWLERGISDKTTTAHMSNNSPWSITLVDGALGSKQEAPCRRLAMMTEGVEGGRTAEYPTVIVLN